MNTITRHIIRLSRLIPLLFLSACHRGESTGELPPVRNFELNRYLGTWFEIARLPHSFERNMQHVSAEYTLRPDGRVRVLNRGIRNGVPREVEGIARLKNPASGNGELEVSFFRPFYGDYKILILEPDYSCAVVTSSTKDYLWILSRERTLNPVNLKCYLARLKHWGYDLSRLEYPVQTEEKPEKTDQITP